VERSQMKLEDAISTSTENPSPERTLAGVAWYEESMKRYRQQNMTQSQRDRLARHLRALRRRRFQEAQLELTRKYPARTD
jgi:hypothetical protein